MAPTRVDGSDPDPSRAPHLINNSWGCPPAEGCNTPNILQTVVENTRTAGILVVASAGNSGSSCSTIVDPPAIYAASLVVGAISPSTRAMASFSSRGPVTVDGSNRIKPDLVAPGVGTRSAVRGGGYASFQGTSMAGPHVAGVAALLMSIDPSLRRDPARVEQILKDTAVADVVTSQTCGGIPPTTIPNPVFGYGRVDALSAARNGLGLLLKNGFE
jgi:subtilisin family serine protease